MVSLVYTFTIFETPRSEKLKNEMLSLCVDVCAYAEDPGLEETSGTCILANRVEYDFSIITNDTSVSIRLEQPDHPFVENVHYDKVGGILWCDFALTLRGEEEPIARSFIYQEHTGYLWVYHGRGAIFVEGCAEGIIDDVLTRSVRKTLQRVGGVLDVLNYIKE